MQIFCDSITFVTTGLLQNKLESRKLLKNKNKINYVILPYKKKTQENKEK
jgi:hypothetical protein